MNAFNQISLRPGRRTKRRAVIMVMNGLFATSACILCGLVVDVGNICVSKAELQRSADASALAAAAVLQDRYDLNGQPTPALVAYNARNMACEYVQSNPCRGVAMTLPRNDGNSENGDLVLGRYNAKTGEFDASSSKYNSAYVFTRRDNVQNGQIPLYFGGLIGMPSINGNAEAAAYVETDIRGFGIETGAKATCGLLPFSLDVNVWQKRIALGIDDFTHDPVNQTVSSGSDEVLEISLYPGRLEPGNFGTVDFGSRNNSTSDLSRQILNGLNADDFSYFSDNKLQLGEDGTLVLNGDTGLSATIQSDLNAIRGQSRILPLHEATWGNGDNAYFRVVAFVGVTILDADLNGAMRNKYVKLQPSYTSDDTAIGGGQEGVTSKFVFMPPRLRKAK